MCMIEWITIGLPQQYLRGRCSPHLHYFSPRSHTTHVMHLISSRSLELDFCFPIRCPPGVELGPQTISSEAKTPNTKETQPCKATMEALGVNRPPLPGIL